MPSERLQCQELQLPKNFIDYASLTQSPSFQMKAKKHAGQGCCHGPPDVEANE